MITAADALCLPIPLFVALYSHLLPYYHPQSTPLATSTLPAPVLLCCQLQAEMLSLLLTFSSLMMHVNCFCPSLVLFIC